MGEMRARAARSSTGRRIAKGFGLLGLLALGARAGGQEFEHQTIQLHDAIGTIQEKAKEVEALKVQAVREGQAIKASCIEDKLRKIKVALHSATVVEDGWSVGRDNPAFAARSMDRVLLLKLYAVAHADDAYNCADTKTAQTTVVKVDSTQPTGQAAGPTIPFDPIPPPVIERPPLASPY
jgi:hypothetical protein